MKVFVLAALVVLVALPASADELWVVMRGTGEIAIVEARKGERGRTELDLLFHESDIQCVPFDEVQADLARVAWRRYGKGRHPAGLNLGDCFSYALSKATSQPLLFKGDDFAQTDLSIA